MITYLDCFLPQSIVNEREIKVSFLYNKIHILNVQCNELWQLNHVTTSQTRYEIFPSPQKVPSCLFSVNNPAPRGNPHFDFYNPRLVFPVPELHINGIVWTLLLCLDSFAQLNVFEIHSCCVISSMSFLLLSGVTYMNI